MVPRAHTGARTTPHHCACASLFSRVRRVCGAVVHCVIASQVRAPAAEVIRAVSDLPSRLQWDPMLTGGTVHKQLDEANTLINIVVKPLARGMRPSDYVLLQSCQAGDAAGEGGTGAADAAGSQHTNGYIVASRSVVADDLPPTAGLHRGAVLPSGFLIEPADPQTLAPLSERRGAAQESAGGTNAGGGGAPVTRLTYVAQMAPLRGITGMAFRGRVINAIMELMVRRFVRLQQHLGGGAGGGAAAAGDAAQQPAPAAAGQEQVELTTAMHASVV